MLFEVYTVCVILLCVCIQSASGQCTFSSPFAGSTWLDSTRGTLVFTDTQVTGWNVTVLNQQITSWDCYNNASTSRLVLKSTNSVLYSTINIDVYACIVLTKITEVSYKYVLQQIQVPDAGYERLLFSNQASLTVSEICDFTANIPALEFHVLVKQGMGASAAITFPNQLLRSVDYEYTASDGTVACNGTQETLDMCTDTTQLSANYSYCSQQIAYTAGGQAWCVATVSNSGYDCAVVMNQDATITGTTSQFACICSNGNRMSVVANNCTANQVPTSYPTAADGVTVIGYILNVESVLVSCAPESASEESSSNAGLIAGVVIVVLVIIGVVVVSVILYKKGKCVTLCAHVKGCMRKTPCWAQLKKCVCCKNRVAEFETPILTNGSVAHADTIDETTSSRPVLLKSKTSMSAITRSSTMMVNREKSGIDKSMTRQATATSIGLDLKSERSVSVNKVIVKSAHGNEETKSEEKPKKDFILSMLPCFRKKPEEKTNDEQTDNEEPPEAETPKGKPQVTKGKKGTAGKGSAAKKAKGETKGKKGKKAKEKPDTATESVDKEKALPADDTQNGVSPVKSPRGKKEKKVVTPRDDKEKPKNSPNQNSERSADLSTTENKTETPKLKREKTTQSKKETPREDGGNKSEVKNDTPRKDAKNKKPDLVRAPTKLDTDLHLTSTPVPGGEKGKKGIISVPAALVKPDDKRTEWTFLSCCFGNRSPPPPDEDIPTDTTEEPPKPTAVKKKPISKPDKKAKGNKKTGGNSKAGGKKGGKGTGTKQPDVNANDVVVEDIVDETPVVERSKTMPEKQREKTSLSIKDAEKVKVDVYIPDDKTNLKLKDTVIVKEKNGEPQLLKAKSDIGLTRPTSSKSTRSSKASKNNETKKGAKKDKKGSEEKSKPGPKAGNKKKKKK